MNLPELDNHSLRQLGLIALLALGADAASGGNILLKPLLKMGVEPPHAIAHQTHDNSVNVLILTNSSGAVNEDQYLAEIVPSQDELEAAKQLIADNPELVIITDFQAGIASLENKAWNNDTIEALIYVLKTRPFYPFYPYGYTLRQIPKGGTDGSYNSLGVHGFRYYQGVNLLWWGQDCSAVSDPWLHSMFGGKVVEIAEEFASPGNSYGWHVDVQNGAWRARYQHVLVANGLNVGDEVETGQVVGKQDSRAHVHVGLAFRADQDSANWVFVPATEVINLRPAYENKGGNAGQVLLPQEYFNFIEQARGK